MSANPTSEQPGPVPQRGDIVIHVFGRTDVGRTREHNEDSYIVADLATAEPIEAEGVVSHWSGDLGSLFMVADGMGGAAAGELASAMAVTVVLRELRERWLESGAIDPPTFVQALKAATEEANASIHKFAGENPEYRGMGTTATVAGFLRNTLFLAQVGDSRAYLIRDGVLHQLTKDQTLIQRLVEAGEMTAEEGERSERRNIILQALGPDPTIKVDLTLQEVRRGDILVLCSDGLSGIVKPSRIQEIARECAQIDELCDRLIEEANDAGGPDNITVIVVRFHGQGLTEASPEDVVAYRRLQDSDPSIPALSVAVPDRSAPAPLPPPVTTGSLDGAIDDDLTRAPIDPALVSARPAPATPPPVDPTRRKRGTLYLALLAIAGVLIALGLVWRVVQRL